ncbi:MAG: flagellar basal body P-ring formation chaperone FlgA [Geminicoccaceae bacterium]
MLLAGGPALADDMLAVFAKRTLRVGALIVAEDVELRKLPEHRAAGVAERLEDVVGREVRRNLYAGRPVQMEDIGAPTVVERNSLVTLAYASNHLELSTVGRALDSGGLNEAVRVVNIDSRITIVGVVAGPGVVRVGSPTEPAEGSR